MEKMSVSAILAKPFAFFFWNPCKQTYVILQ